MKKPWQIWSLYFGCLLMVIPAMVWFSAQSLNLEKARETDRIQTELARREAELQERVSSALWRMDGFLTNLIARESTRPWYWYQAFFNETMPKNELESISKKTKSMDSALCIASPLLYQDFPYVKLHFEVDRNNSVTSPQLPTKSELSQAGQLGRFNLDWDSNNLLKEQFEEISDYGFLSASCSSELLSSPKQTVSRGGVTVPAGDLSATGSDEQVLLEKSPAPPVEIVNDMEQLEQQTSRGYQSDGIQKQMVQQSRNVARSEDEFSQRQQYASNALSEWQQNRLPNTSIPSDSRRVESIQEGVMQPVWLNDHLLLVRRVKRNNEPLVQGCWMNWQKLQTALTEMVEDILPEVQFEPILDPAQIAVGQALATLPVQLVIDRSKLIETLDLENRSDNLEGVATSQTNVFRSSLWFAWLGLAFAAIGGGILLRGLLQLSERREAFVSAVSHELRTPLTTFRMYAEMLAEKMVPAERQQQYAQTLKVEAERLSHLVENVLQFARLERSRQKTRLERATLESILVRFVERLETHVELSNMELVQEITDQMKQQELWTDPAAIEQILFNLVDNACKYAATADNRQIVLSAQKLGEKQMLLSVRDFGPGIPAKDRSRLFRPFHKSDMEAANTAQGVGLGLALCRRMAKSLGGQLRIGNLPAGQPGAILELIIPQNN